MIVNFPFITMVLVTIIGFCIIIFRKNLLKIIMGISLIESAMNLFIVALDFKQGGIAPIFTLTPLESGVQPAAAASAMVLPVPQALCLTSIVIAVATGALMLSFAMLIYRKYGTLDISKIRRLNG